MSQVQPNTRPPEPEPHVIAVNAALAQCARRAAGPSDPAADSARKGKGPRMTAGRHVFFTHVLSILIGSGG